MYNEQGSPLKKMKTVDPQRELGNQRFEKYLTDIRDSDYDNNNKIIIDSRNYRNDLGENTKPVRYTLDQIMSNYVHPLSDGEIITEYTEDDHANEQKESDDDIQVYFPVSFRLVKLISSFNTIRSYYQSPPRLSEDLMSYLNRELINNTEEMSVSSKKESIIKWVKTNNVYCQELYRILNSWPVKTSRNLTVFTGFNFEIPDVGDFRNIMVDEVINKNVGETITIPFVLSTSISPYVAKKYTTNEGIILQIIIPAGFPIPYISRQDSQELEVLFNMFGIYKKVNINQINPRLRDVRSQVICLELIGFNKINTAQMNENTDIICDIISQEMVEDSLNEIDGGKNKKKVTRTKRYIKKSKRKSSNRKLTKRGANKQKSNKRHQLKNKKIIHHQSSK